MKKINRIVPYIVFLLYIISIFIILWITRIWQIVLFMVPIGIFSYIIYLRMTYPKYIKQFDDKEFFDAYIQGQKNALLYYRGQLRPFPITFENIHSQLRWKRYRRVGNHYQKSLLTFLEDQPHASKVVYHIYINNILIEPFDNDENFNITILITDDIELYNLGNFQFKFLLDEGKIARQQYSQLTVDKNDKRLDFFSKRIFRRMNYDKKITLYGTISNVFLLLDDLFGVSQKKKIITITLLFIIVFVPFLLIILLNL